MKKLFLCSYFTGVKEVFKNLEMEVEDLEISKQIVEKYLWRIKCKARKVI